VNRTSLHNRGRASISAAQYTPDGSRIVCAAEDGSVRVWSTKAPFVKPILVGSVYLNLCFVSSHNNAANT
jgi:WD40 repeat protein